MNKNGFMRFPNHCIIFLFNLHITQLPNFSENGIVIVMFGICMMVSVRGFFSNKAISCTHSSDCEHRSPSHLLLKLCANEGQPIKRNLALKEGELRGK